MTSSSGGANGRCRRQGAKGDGQDRRGFRDGNEFVDAGSRRRRGTWRRCRSSSKSTVLRSVAYVVFGVGEALEDNPALQAACARDAVPVEDRQRARGRARDTEEPHSWSPVPRSIVELVVCSNKPTVSLKPVVAPVRSVPPESVTFRPAVRRRPATGHCFASTTVPASGDRNVAGDGVGRGRLVGDQRAARDGGQAGEGVGGRSRRSRTSMCRSCSARRSR